MVTKWAVSCTQGELLVEGKTKKIYDVVDEPWFAIVESKDDITAGDGKKHDVIPGKARMSTETTDNVFKFLANIPAPLAYLARRGETSFLAYKTRMLPYEVVIRGEADGSYIERYPDVQRGTKFAEPIVEFFLKTKDKSWKGKDLVCDDPLMEFGKKGEIRLFNPHKRRQKQKPFLRLATSDVYTMKHEETYFLQMRTIARTVFDRLAWAWMQQGGRLIDLKIEFGIDREGKLLLSDVIDNDSWRVWYNGNYIDKQRYRDGEDLKKVAEAYAMVAQLTSRFQMLGGRGL